MWILLGGRMAKAMAEEVTKESGELIQGVEYVEDIFRTLGVQGNGYFSGVDGFIVLDAALRTLKNWDDIRRLADLHPGKPVYVMNRFKEFSPERDTMPDNVVWEDADEITVGRMARFIIMFRTGTSRQGQKPLESVVQ